MISLKLFQSVARYNFNPYQALIFYNFSNLLIINAHV